MDLWIQRMQNKTLKQLAPRQKINLHSAYEKNSLRALGKCNEKKTVGKPKANLT